MGVGEEGRGVPRLRGGRLDLLMTPRMRPRMSSMRGSLEGCLDLMSTAVLSINVAMALRPAARIVSPDS